MAGKKNNHSLKRLIALGLQTTFYLVAAIKRSLSFSGLIAALILGFTLMISGGLIFIVPLLTFFLSASFLTHYKGEKKKSIEKDLYEKTGKRDHIQVIANGGAAFIIGIIHLFTHGELTVLALFAAFAATNADTWASELGILSRKRPISIINFKPVQKGISGGITFLGCHASVGGSFLITMVYIPAMLLQNMDCQEIIINSILIFSAGVIGASIDSILGALVQPVYVHTDSGRFTEKEFQNGTKNRKIKGFYFFSNDMINFISSGFAVCIAVLIKIYS